MTELAKQLKERNISQNRLAAVAGVSKQYVSSVLQGKRQATSKLFSAVETLTSITQEGKPMPQVKQAPQGSQPPVMIIDKRLEIQPVKELVDPTFCQISPALTEDRLNLETSEDVQREYQEVLRIRELIACKSLDVPQVHLLKLGPRRYLVLRGATTVKAFQTFGTMPAWTYRASDSDLPFIAGLK